MLEPMITNFVIIVS